MQHNGVLKHVCMYACMKRGMAQGAVVVSLCFHCPNVWLCLSCRPPFSEVLERVVQLETELDSLKLEVQTSS